MRISAGSAQATLSVWWVACSVWLAGAGSSMVGDPHPTGEPDLGPAVAAGMALVLVLTVAAVVTLGAMPLMVGARFTGSWNIVLGVLEFAVGVATTNSDWRSASSIIGDPPVWVELVASGWANVIFGAAVVTLLVSADRRSRRVSQPAGAA